MAGFLKSRLILVFHCSFKSAAGTGHFFSFSYLKFWIMVGHSLSLNSFRMSAPRYKSTLWNCFVVQSSPRCPHSKLAPCFDGGGRHNSPLPLSPPHLHFPFIPCLPTLLLSQHTQCFSPGEAFPLYVFSWPCSISQTHLHLPVLLRVSYFWGLLLGEPLLSRNLSLVSRSELLPRPSLLPSFPDLLRHE